MSGRRRRRRADLSQHFLRSRGLARTLVRRSELSAADLVIEIGAGSGVLTAALAERVREVRAIEVDSRLASRLRGRFAEERSVAVLEADFFATELPRERYSVFANVPFARTADVVRRLTEARSQPEDVYLVVQAEAAARFLGRPFRDETVQSLKLKPWWHGEVVHWFERHDFEPPPGVDCVLLWLAQRPRPLIADEQRSRYLRFVSRAFGIDDVGRGLRGRFTARELAILGKRLGFGRRESPTTLSFEQWLALFRQQAVARR